MPKKNKLKDEEARAAFIFTGTVVKTKAGLIEKIIPKNTAIFHVDHIIKAPAMFASLTGHEITVRFKKLPVLRKNKVLTVFANGWIFSDSIAVDAVGYTEETGKMEMASSVNSAMTTAANSVLKERIDSSELGVVGKVIKIEKAAMPDIPFALSATRKKATSNIPTTQISEHDPNWHEATIKVDEVVKGAKNVKTVKLLFPKSDDVRWYKVAKYQVGQQGVWLLQGKKQNPKGIPPKILAALPPEEDIFTALHSSDYLPLSELGKLKSLIQK